MIEIAQWRSCIGQFAQKHHGAVYVKLVLVHRDKEHSRLCLTPVCVLVIATVLLMAGDVEPNGKKG